MRLILTYDCCGSACHATLDEAEGTTGLFIVSGGNEIRCGTHRGMAKLAGELAARGFPVFRFDRRGVGDSEGENSGFEHSEADIMAALAAFRSAQPHLDRIVALGNCDAATALLLHPPAGIAALVLSNPWIVNVAADAASPASTRAYYADRLRDPRAWLKLLRGGVNIRKTADSLTSAIAPTAQSDLALRVAQAMHKKLLPTRIVLAAHDGTAISFADQWSGALFDPVRERVAVEHIPSASHSFASAPDHATFLRAVLESL